ncbi:Conserved oligomeric Golgi complex subunit 6 [Carpediemonas membranifera]|uniref:Conserved oligomeric Golgi complex subunit 6 n=1 Tax=Carpediemonas membranifera TaxID=201153 RepID=A0A8J6AUQ2_9EUKA|nr:Conserved oligomeric Golgi complex subunit 6 [Carpediemonas membranifera]|eukprot:KAG9395221.1 Conserved oligomeric Golgi complex subunit 6 [Carpediemonas membranifera]
MDIYTCLYRIAEYLRENPEAVKDKSASKEDFGPVVAMEEGILGSLGDSIHTIENKCRSLRAELTQLKANLSRVNASAAALKTTLRPTVMSYRALVDEQTALKEHRQLLSDYITKLSLTDEESAVIVSGRLTEAVIPLIRRLDEIKQVSTEMLTATDYCEAGEHVARSCDLHRQRLFEAVQREVSTAVSIATKQDTAVSPLIARVMTLLVASAPVTCRLASSSIARSRETAFSMACANDIQEGHLATIVAVFTWLHASLVSEAKFVTTTMLPPDVTETEVDQMFETTMECLEEIPRHALTAHIQPRCIELLERTESILAVFECIALAEALPLNVAEANAAAIQQVSGVGCLGRILARDSKALTQMCAAISSTCIEKFDALVKVKLPLPEKQSKLTHRLHQPSVRFDSGLKLLPAMFETVKNTLGPGLHEADDARGVGLALSQYSNALLRHASLHSSGRDPTVSALLMLNAIAAMEAVVGQGVRGVDLHYAPLDHVVALLEEQRATFADIVVGDELAAMLAATNLVELENAMNTGTFTGLNVVAADALQAVRAVLTTGFNYPVLSRVQDSKLRLSLQSQVESSFMMRCLAACDRLRGVENLDPGVSKLILDEPTLRRVFGL